VSSHPVEAQALAAGKIIGKSRMMKAAGATALDIMRYPLLPRRQPAFSYFNLGA
jgi:hypothetical protein